MQPVYLDYNATTPTDPRVFEAMRRYSLVDFGNASSLQHSPGKTARDAVEDARRKVGGVLSVKPEEILFTSGATESNNLVLLGLASRGRGIGRTHILASAIEHTSVLGPLNVLGRDGFDVELLPVCPDGYVCPSEVRARIRSDTLVVSIMHANNETGVLQPLAEIHSLLADSGVLFHVDAAQTFGKEIQELRTLKYDFLSLSGHKILGPKGIGALCVRRSGQRFLPLAPLMHGGGQEMGLRPGTLPVPLIVGLGVAAELAIQEHDLRRTHNAALRRDFLTALQAVEHVINGDPTRMQEHVLNVSFEGVDGKALMMSLRESMAFSDGAACSVGTAKRSHVLHAMGLPEDRIESSVRFSWGPGVGRVPFDQLIYAVRTLSSQPL
jgi:cysteine desulfurase